MNIEEEIQKELDTAILNQFTYTCTNPTTQTESLTKEKLEELIKMMEPYNKCDQAIYPFLFKYEPIKLEPEKDDYHFDYLKYYGTPIIKPTRTIYIKVQKRKNKKKRINKKWAKKYGYIEIPKEVPLYCFDVSA